MRVVPLIGEIAAKHRPKLRRLRQPRYGYEDAVRFLVDRGVDETDLRFGSILGNHLDFIRATTLAQIADRRPLVGLHIGNFVGVSLASFANTLRDVHADSTTVAIDPNVETAGIENPQQHVIALLDHYRLLGSVLLVSSYSFEKTELSGAAPAESFPPSGLDALPQLARLGVRFDVALVDGNHRGSTVSRELGWLKIHLNPGGIVFLDDVTDAWHEIKDVFSRESDTGTWTALGHDGRIGALKRA